ncbi:MAG: zinc-finger domain-containing protein [Gammaproteobacteria bacterium]
MTDEHSKATETGTGIPNDKREYEIGANDLPLHCPTPQMSLWNSHPRVYLPIEASGHAKCPYCGAEYTLKQ